MGLGYHIGDYDKGAMGMGDEGCQKTVYIDNSSALGKELSVLKGEYNKLKRELAETKDTLAHRTWELQEANKKLPRLRYVDKDGWPEEIDAMYLCYTEDGNLFQQFNDKDMGLMNDGYPQIIAWMPMSEFLNAFVGDSNVSN